MSTWSQFRIDASKHVSRKTGGSAVASAAYRAGECLWDEREQQTADYSGRYGVVASGIAMPEKGGPDWTRERLWNEAEAAEARKDARTARKIELALPEAMAPEQRRELVLAWAAELADRYGVAVDWAIHLPDRKGDKRNHHAHMMMTTREIGPGGFGGKAALELSNADQRARGLPVGDQAIQRLRELMAERFNEVAERHALELRADPRSYRERGVALVPTRHVGVAGVGMDRRGAEADRVRAHEATRGLNAARIEARPELLFEVLTGKEAVFTRRDVARELHRYVDDPGRFAAVMARLDASPELVRLSRDDGGEPARYSTREMVAVEARLAEAAGAMARAGTHRVSPGLVRAALDRHGHLSAEQREAVEHATAPGQLAVVVGSAGTGKSRSLAAAREVWEAQGYRVQGAALAGKAAEELQGSAGMPSRTLASLEFAWGKGRERLAARDVLVIDEAGMVGSRQLGRVLDAARMAGAKVVLVGDERQLQPIEAGAAFRAVVERVGAAEVRGVRRTREEWARAASQAFARGAVAEGLAAYSARGRVRMEGGRGEAKAAIARDYVADGEGAGSRLIVAHTNRDVREINDAVRAERRRRGELAHEAAFATARGARGFAGGDRVVFLQNSRELGVKNGTLGTVERAGAGRLLVRLDEQDRPGAGRRVEVAQDAYRDVDHGYAVTVHKSQGATVDRAYVLASGGMDAHLAYVAMTRHRDAATLYAGRDDFADGRALSRRLGRARSKASTLDYAERRGFETVRAWVEDARAWIERGRERLAEAWQRAEELRAAFPQPQPEPEPVAGGWPWRELAVLERAAAPTAAEAARRPPLLAARDGPPARPEDAPEAVAAAVAGDGTVRAARSVLRSALYWVYRDLDAAEAALGPLERELGGPGAAGAALARRPKLLGELRGRGGPFRSAQAEVDRTVALRRAPEIGPALVGLREAERSASDRLGAEAAWRRQSAEERAERDRVALPALSVRAVGAVRALLAAGAEPGWRDPPPWDPEPKPGDAERAVRVAPVWEAARRDPALRAELDGFARAARVRFPPDRVQDVLEERGQDGPGPGAVEEEALGACVAGVLASAELLHRHRAWFEAHAEQQRCAELARAEEERREAARREVEAAKRAELEAERARADALRRLVPRRDPGPRSSGPGPGM